MTASYAPPAIDDGLLDFLEESHHDCQAGEGQRTGESPQPGTCSDATANRNNKRRHEPSHNDSLPDNEHKRQLTKESPKPVACSDAPADDKHIAPVVKSSTSDNKTSGLTASQKFDRIDPNYWDQDQHPPTCFCSDCELLMQII
jgi:hypothetical protein